MARRAAAAISLSSAGRLVFEPEKPVSTYSAARKKKKGVRCGMARWTEEENS
jgi:hypothetical protein